MYSTNVIGELQVTSEDAVFFSNDVENSKKTKTKWAEIILTKESQTRLPIFNHNNGLRIRTGR